MKRKLTPEVLEAIRIAREQEALSLTDLCARFTLAKGTMHTALRALGLGKLTPTETGNRERRRPRTPETHSVPDYASHAAASKARGDAAEAVILAELVKAGKVVLLPFGDKERYDMVIHTFSGKFLRVQCKSAWTMPDRPHVACFRIAYHKGYGRKVAQHYSKADVDGLAVWVPIYNHLLWVPIEALEGYKGETLCVNFDVSARGKWAVKSPEDFPFSLLLEQ